MNNIVFHNINNQTNGESPLLLKSYLMFTDSQTNEKFVIINYFNNDSEPLSEIEFAVTQYNHDGKKIKTSEYNFTNLKVISKKSFVPYGKIKIEDNCENVEVSLISALYRTKKWVDNSWIVLENIEESNDVDINTTQIITKDTIVQTKIGKKLFPFPYYISIVALSLFILISIVSFALYYTIFTDYSSNKFAYLDINNQSVVITEYQGLSKKVVIPESIDGKLVKEIAVGAFENSNIKSVKIEAKNVTISSYAFANCENLQEVSGISVRTIESNAFKNCMNLIYVSFDSIDRIQSKAFVGCSNLKTFISNGEVYVESLAFENCRNLEYVNMPNATISKRAFLGNKNMQYLNFKNSDAKVFGELFRYINSDVPITLKNVSFEIDYISDKYFENLFQIQKLNIKNIKEAYIEYGALSYCNLEGYVNYGEYEVLDNILITSRTNITQMYIYKDVIDVSLNAFNQAGPTLEIINFLSDKNIHLQGQHFFNCLKLRYLVLGPNMTTDPGALYPLANTLNYLEMPVLGYSLGSLFYNYSNVLSTVHIIGNGTLPKDYFANYEYIYDIIIDDSVIVGK